MDVYELPSLGGAQLHDLNPTPPPPTGLFWTMEIPGDIDVQLGKGSADMEVSNAAVLDHYNIPNALFGGRTPTPSTVSFKIQWRGVGERANVRNTDPIYGGFAGEFVRNTAQMEWTATAGDYRFVSAPLRTSSSSFAEIGHERNGVFFP